MYLKGLKLCFILQAKSCVFLQPIHWRCFLKKMCILNKLSKLRSILTRRTFFYRRCKFFKLTLKMLKFFYFSRENGSSSTSSDSTRSKPRLFNDSILSSSGGSVDRRHTGKSIDRKSSGSDYSGSGSRKSSSDRKLSASRHSLVSRGSDLWTLWSGFRLRCFRTGSAVLLGPGFPYSSDWDCDSDRKYCIPRTGNASRTGSAIFLGTEVFLGPEVSYSSDRKYCIPRTGSASPDRKPRDTASLYEVPIGENMNSSVFKYFSPHSCRQSLKCLVNTVYRYIGTICRYL